ncbi:MAG TPA: D-alanyl-D-alanine carboxypeptidase/D-alanyl-D-alanine-endopeptidase [Gaiellaceae bacterium]|nr:D-alanyl-D-alanine carboxypeptidase/D-alanyl-D-alanine-endopeptidase [Gaiellaceae bacterium]
MRVFFVSIAISLLLAPSAPAVRLPLPTRLAHALEVPSLTASSSGAIAIDLASGGVVFERNADTSLAPASNEKLPVTFAALRTLGPAYRFPTEVLGRGQLVGTTWQGDLYLKGYGDPSLTASGLARLAAALKKQGIKHVSGRVLADESWFDSRRAAPGWKSSFFVNECSPLSALVVDRGVYDDHIALRPAVAAAGRFRQVLRRHKITTGMVALGKAPDTAVPLARIASAPLEQIVTFMDRQSDNFTAEMLLKQLGAMQGTGGTSAAGAAVVVDALREAAIPLTGVRIVDGSGLSLDDRITVRALAALLVGAWSDPSMRPVLWGALPVAGISGTLRNRLQTAPARGAVRAKTGTTNEASALSGYVRSRYAFAVLENGAPVSYWSAHKAEDRFATALAVGP